MQVEHRKSSAVRVFRAVSLLDKKILTAQIATGQQRFMFISISEIHFLKIKFLI
jgi:hypothetical protein